MIHVNLKDVPLKVKCINCMANMHPRDPEMSNRHLRVQYTCDSCNAVIQVFVPQGNRQ